MKEIGELGGVGEVRVNRGVRSEYSVIVVFCTFKNSEKDGITHLVVFCTAKTAPICENPIIGAV
ncbi:hypothetical protein [Paenibacillus sp. FSL R7-0337]|uniref:hypothetical protein n=1 Tax=unclassified Paenibacillus TaxID=185978 RepID=UPI0011812FED|nr:hypothetical protein [Paenibacillus sp. FSL R7-0337]